ncbi:MAG: glycosyltransferase [Lentisphaeria bacterium]|nr:glycosyltransferase [Lentisphaeria bacterium]
MKFSVLMSSYCKDKPDELLLALRSIWDDQTVKPSEIVIVKDGPLTAELDSVINHFAQSAPVKIVPLPENRGLGLALAEGIKHCSFDYIARMDGDDISLPERFAKQVAFMEQNPDISICGGMIQEFSGSPDNISSKRTLPLSDMEIRKFCKWRSPFNHVTVMYRKKTVLDAGNYQNFLSYEDYWLWARILQKGNRAANLPDILVNVRAGENMLKRRRGWRFFTAEIKLAKKLKSIGIINMSEMLRNMLFRAPARLMPGWLLAWVYNHFCRK